MLAIVPLFIGTTELLLIAALVLLLFGGKKFPEMMKGLGQGMQSFKKGMNEPISEEKKENEQNAESKVSSGSEPKSE
jgi:sec-independent protein translocase protein TatA